MNWQFFGIIFSSNEYIENTADWPKNVSAMHMKIIHHKMITMIIIM